MEIFLGADHNGFKLKEKIKKYLKKMRIDFKDLGNSRFDPKDDYPDFAILVAKKVAKTKAKGILICGSGGGMCITANKIKGIRAAQAFTIFQTRHLRKEDDINILCLDGWELKEKIIKEIVRTFLKTKFSKLIRHKRRIQKIEKIEKK
ncbi:RpiB/LacA/LacB family sugar-phosphate isomerase [Patescibacteria group bacterium]|nr:RpiB/LacA/LacB family sugar-phosphate isomerase [Patescibacteria group bacterium]